MKITGHLTDAIFRRYDITSAAEYPGRGTAALAAVRLGHR
jgi:hypothetical protein